jgi:lipoyl(octanoyl) transferase
MPEFMLESNPLLRPQTLAGMSALSRRTRWGLVLTSAARGAENMALDEALMERARRTGEWILRVYSWRSPTLSLGRNQTARGRYDLERLREHGVDVVRRPTGGRAILHSREITYSVTAPVDDAGSLRESYQRINRLLTTALSSLGVHAVAATAAGHRHPSPGMTPCFDEPAAGELTVDGRKLAGSAQWRNDGALLQHGSILVGDDQSALAELTVGGGVAIPTPATLAGILAHVPSPRDLTDALAAAVRSLEDPDASEIALDDEIRARTSALVVRYLDDAWTWRR